MKKKFIAILMLAMVVAEPVYAGSTSTDDSIKTLLKQYDHTIYQYVTDIASLDDTMESYKNKSAEEISAFTNLYTNSLNKLQQTTQDRNAIAQQLETQDKNLILEFRKVLMDNTEKLGSTSNLRPPIKNISIVGRCYGNCLNYNLEDLETNNGINYVVFNDSQIIAQFNRSVSSVEGDTVTINHDGDIVTKYTGLKDIRVKKGDIVKQYQEIGKPDNNNNMFHTIGFEIKYKNKNINPNFIYQ